MEANIAKVEEEKAMLNLNIDSNCMSSNCLCNELEERIKKDEVKCEELEIELQKIKERCQALEAKVNVLEGEKLAVEDEMKVLKMSNEVLKRQKEVSSEIEREIKTVADLTEENEVVQLMTENKVLECEKKWAEIEVKVWKDKCKKLESWALQLGMGRDSYFHEENRKKHENKQINTEGNLHLDTCFDFKQNQEKVADLENVASSCISPCKEIGDMQFAEAVLWPSSSLMEILMVV